MSLDGRIKALEDATYASVMELGAIIVPAGMDEAQHKASIASEAGRRSAQGSGGFVILPEKGSRH